MASHYPNCWRVCRSVRPKVAGAVVAKNELISSRPSGTRNAGPERRTHDVSEVVCDGAARRTASGPARGWHHLRRPGGTALGVALERAEHVVVACSAISRASRQRAERRLPDTRVLPVQDVAANAELLILAIPDVELAGVVAENWPPPGRSGRAPSSCTLREPTASRCSPRWPNSGASRWRFIPP